MDKLSLLYIALTAILTFWAFADMAFQRKVEYRWLWWVIILALPPLGAIIYFHYSSRRVLNRSFRAIR
jgi:hypothetical protein